jgi:hypothetical protein
MKKQPTRRRRARRAAAQSLAYAVAVAALVAVPGAGHAVATLAPPDERVLERRGGTDHQAVARQAGQQGEVEQPSQDSPAGAPQRRFRPEPLPWEPPPQFDDEQVTPAPRTAAPASGRGGLVVMAVVAALLLAGGATTTWRVRQRRPQPESTV